MHRGFRCPPAVESGYIQVQTVWYRAPEVLFGSFAFGVGIDVWSLGLVMAEMCGSEFHMVHKDAAKHAVKLVAYLGTPTATSITSLPLFPRRGATALRQAWPPYVREVLGSVGVSCLDWVLTWAPEDRPGARTVLTHPYLNPEQLVSASIGLYTGIRHDWSVVSGVMAVEVLQWLTKDPAFDSLEVVYEGRGADFKTEEQRKWVKAAAISKCASGSMCTLSLKKAFPLQRVSAWFAAFRAVNAEAIASLAAAAALECKRLSPTDLGDNGRDFLSTPLNEWFLTAAELNVTKAGDATTGFWTEPRHKDGGASVLHLGLTLFGRRSVFLEQSDDKPTVRLDCQPGHVYLATLTGPWHWAAHAAAEPDELWGDSLSVTVMCRTALFAKFRARGKATMPNPEAFFRTLTASFANSLLSGIFRLPTLKNVLDAYSGDIERESLAEPGGGMATEGGQLVIMGPLHVQSSAAAHGRRCQS